jgi:hypothetical protein
MAIRICYWEDLYRFHRGRVYVRLPSEHSSLPAPWHELAAEHVCVHQGCCNNFAMMTATKIILKLSPCLSTAVRRGTVGVQLKPSAFTNSEMKESPFQLMTVNAPKVLEAPVLPWLLPDISGYAIGNTLHTVTGSTLGTAITNTLGTVTGSILGTVTGSTLGTVTGSTLGTVTGSTLGTVTGSTLGQLSWQAIQVYLVCSMTNTMQFSVVRVAVDKRVQIMLEELLNVRKCLSCAA